MIQLANRTRNNQILFRLNDAEYASLVRDVERTGITREAYLRNLIASTHPVQTREQLKLAQEIKKELHKIGNNLNQLARLAHANGWLLPERYDAAVAELHDTLKRIER